MQQFGNMCIRIVLVTNTCPPHRLTNFIKPFGIKPSRITEVRAATNRPDIGMHVVRIQPILAMQSLERLVSALCDRMADEERILVFFSSQVDLESFEVRAKCAVYHSGLDKSRSPKAYNFHRWDVGETKVMACTTAFIQCMHRPHIRYVVIFRPSYGLVLNNQMLCRAGQDEKESHVFFLTDQTGDMCRGPSTNECVGELDDLVHGKRCRRFVNMLCMDGDNFAMKCTDEPQGIYCDVCDPNSFIQRLAMQSIGNPLVSPEVPQFACSQVIASSSSLQGHSDSPHLMSTECVQVSDTQEIDISVKFFTLSVIHHLC